MSDGTKTIGALCVRTKYTHENEANAFSLDKKNVDIHHQLYLKNFNISTGIWLNKRIKMFPF